MKQLRVRGYYAIINLGMSYCHCELTKKNLWMLNLGGMNMGVLIQFFSTLCTFGNLKQKLEK